MTEQLSPTLSPTLDTDPAISSMASEGDADESYLLEGVKSSDEYLSTRESAQRIELLLPAIARRVLGPHSDHPSVMLPLAQLRLCALLLREGRRTMSQIGDDLAISVSAVTQMADRLEKAGMVERVAETGGDRRTRHLQLTVQGTEIMTSRRAARVARAEAILQTLEPSQRRDIVDAFTTLLEASKAVPGPDLTELNHVEPHL